MHRAQASQELQGSEGLSDASRKRRAASGAGSFPPGRALRSAVSGSRRQSTPRPAPKHTLPQPFWARAYGRFRRNRRLRPKTAFSRFPSVDRADLEGRQRVESGPPFPIQAHPPREAARPLLDAPDGHGARAPACRPAIQSAATQPWVAAPRRAPPPPFISLIWAISFAVPPNKFAVPPIQIRCSFAPSRLHATVASSIIS